MEVMQFLMRQIDDLNNVQAARAAIVEVIRIRLEQVKESLGEWEKIHLTNAISALGLNTDAVQQPTNAWLRLCLADLDKAFTPSQERGQPLPDRAVAAEAVNHEKLRQALESVARKIEQLR